MSLVVPQSAEQLILAHILNGTTPEELDIRLYTAGPTPNELSVVADFSVVEVDQGGYAAIQLHLPANPLDIWTIVPGNPSVGTHTQVTFTFTGAPTVPGVVGYYVTQRSSGDLMWAEEFTNGPYVIATSSDQIRITPRITAD